MGQQFTIPEQSDGNISSHISDTWKIATVTPLPKGGEMNNVSNYRPISVLPVPGKVLERLMHTAISQHLDTNEILSPFQGGYQKGKSTTDTISDFVDDILKERNIGNFTMAAFIDIKKAFDSVNYFILLKKLEIYGIREKNLDLIKNYLKNRKQCTIANNIKSNDISLSCGVPQGSILGPLFFLLYINDCIKPDDSHKTMLYADDSVLYVSGNDFPIVEAKLNSALRSFSTWSGLNKLTVNESKTKVMVFAAAPTLKRLPKPTVKLKDVTLQQVISYKYLGIIVDQELNFASHVKELLKNIRFKSLLLFYLKKMMSRRVLLHVYKSYVLPIIDYADEYMNTHADLLEALQRAQSKINV